MRNFRLAFFSVLFGSCVLVCCNSFSNTYGRFKYSFHQLKTVDCSSDIDIIKTMWRHWKCDAIAMLVWSS